MDFDNKFHVVAHEKDLMVLNPAPMIDGQRQRYSKQDALNLAAWLVVLANTDREFDDLLCAVWDACHAFADLARITNEVLDSAPNSAVAATR